MYNRSTRAHPQMQKLAQTHWHVHTHTQTCLWAHILFLGGRGEKAHVSRSCGLWLAWGWACFLTSLDMARAAPALLHHEWGKEGTQSPAPGELRDTPPHTNLLSCSGALPRVSTCRPPRKAQEAAWLCSFTKENMEIFNSNLHFMSQFKEKRDLNLSLSEPRTTLSYTSEHLGFLSLWLCTQ